MAKQNAITPMPFPGESPTVALAMAAGQKYGLHEEDAKPAKKARPKRKATAAKKTSASGKKAAAPPKKAAASRKAGPARKKAAS